MSETKNLPRVGIRPVIDGRRMGVHKSLEAQTMTMTRATAALISARLRYACGTPVECVIAEHVSPAWRKQRPATRSSIPATSPSR